MHGTETRADSTEPTSVSRRPALAIRSPLLLCIYYYYYVFCVFIFYCVCIMWIAPLYYATITVYDFPFAGSITPRVTIKICNGTFIYLLSLLFVTTLRSLASSLPFFHTSASNPVLSLLPLVDASSVPPPPVLRSLDAFPPPRNRGRCRCSTLFVPNDPGTRTTASSVLDHLSVSPRSTGDCRRTNRDPQ